MSVGIHNAPSLICGERVDTKHLLGIVRIFSRKHRIAIVTTGILGFQDQSIKVAVCQLENVQMNALNLSVMDFKSKGRERLQDFGHLVLRKVSYSNSLHICAAHGGDVLVHSTESSSVADGKK